MARAKKESHPVTIRMEQVLFERMTEFCERSGQPKTVAIERALTEYIDAYDEMMQRAAKDAEESQDLSLWNRRDTR